VTCYIPRWFTRPQTVTHPSSNPAALLLLGLYLRVFINITVHNISVTLFSIICIMSLTHVQETCTRNWHVWQTLCFCVLFWYKFQALNRTHQLFITHASLHKKKKKKSLFCETKVKINDVNYNNSSGLKESCEGFQYKSSRLFQVSCTSVTAVKLRCQVDCVKSHHCQVI